MAGASGPDPDPLPPGKGWKDDIGWTQLSEEEEKEAEIMMEKKGVAGCKEYFKSKLEEWKKIPLNIGVIGNSGSGKSSFINTIRDLSAEDEGILVFDTLFKMLSGAAAVGVTEQTFEVTKYPHTKHENLVFSDLPGAGTPEWPKETYLVDIGFKDYDFFIIICSGRFTETDMYLAKEIREKKKSFFFVRSKIQSDIDNDRRAYRTIHKADPNGRKNALLEKIRNNLKDNLKDLFVDDHVFLIDSYERNSFDFEALEQCLINDFPALKREALILCMSAKSDRMIMQKVKALRGNIWKVSVLSALVAAAPIAGLSASVDLTLITFSATYYFFQLGLDDKSIEQLAETNKSHAEMLKKIVYENKLGELLTVKGVTAFATNLGNVATSMVVEEATRFVPIVGSVAAGGISYVTTGHILGQILDLFKDVAIEVMHASLKENVDSINDELD